VPGRVGRHVITCKRWERAFNPSLRGAALPGVPVSHCRSHCPEECRTLWCYAGYVDFEQASVAVPAVASANNYNEVEIREIPSLRALGKLRCNIDQGVSTLCWSKSGMLGVGGRCLPEKNGSAHIAAFDPNSRGQPKPVGSHTQAVTSMCFLDDSSVLSAGADGQIQVTDTRSRSTSVAVNKPSQLTDARDDEAESVSESCVCARPIGQPHFVAAAFSEGLKIFDMRMRHDVPLMKLTLPSHAGEIIGMQTSECNQHLVVNTLRSSELCIVSASKLLQCGWKDTIETDRILRGHASAASVQPALSPTGSIAACGGKDGSVCVWDINSSELQKRIAAHVTTVEDVSFLPAAGGAILVCSSTDGGLAALGAPLESKKGSSDQPPGAEVEPAVGERVKVRLAGGRSRETVVEGVVGDIGAGENAFGPPERSCTVRVLKQNTSNAEETEHRAHVPLAMIKRTERKEEQPVLPTRTTRSQAYGAGTGSGNIEVPKKRERELEAWLGIVAKHAEVMSTPKPMQTVPPPPAAEGRSGPAAMGSGSLVKQVTGSRAAASNAQANLSSDDTRRQHRELSQHATGRGRGRSQSLQQQQQQSQQAINRAQQRPVAQQKQPEQRARDDLVKREQWVQCDRCSKWRRLQGRVSMEELPSVWYCSMNRWRLDLASCNAPEEADALPRSRPQALQYHSAFQRHNQQSREDDQEQMSQHDADAAFSLTGAPLSAAAARAHEHEAASETQDPELEGF